MNTLKVKDAEIAFKISKNLSHWLRYFSIYTWNRIGFSRVRNRLKVIETTITQNLIFEMSMALKQFNWTLKMYESTKEDTRGNDLEVIIETNKGYVMLPCQAKIIYKSNKYEAIDHVLSTKIEPKIESYQIDFLINYAQERQGIPIYLLYNFCSDSKSVVEIEKKIHPRFDIEEFGCSIVYAEIIKRNYCDKRVNRKKKLAWIIPSFKDLHPNLAIPFHQFIEFISNFNFINNNKSQANDILPNNQAKGMLTNNQMNDILLDNQLNGILTDNQLKYYTIEEIKNDPDWIDIFDGGEKVTIKTEPKLDEVNMQLNEDVVNMKFQPKFRFVFHKKDWEN